MTKLEELKAAYKAATPGEWRRNGVLLYEGVRIGDEGFDPAIKKFQTLGVLGDHDQFGYDNQLSSADNANFIALSHNLMPQLLEAVEQRQKLIDVIDALPSDVKTKHNLYSLVPPLEKLK